MLQLLQQQVAHCSCFEGNIMMQDVRVAVDFAIFAIILKSAEYYFFIETETVHRCHGSRPLRAKPACWIANKPYCTLYFLSNKFV